MKKLIIIILAVIVLYSHTQVIIASAPDVPLADKPVQQIVEYYFGDKAPEMTAIFTAESHLNPKAINWNCEYVNNQGKTYSTSCKKEDRSKAWSVDCGIAQLNVHGQICPETLLNAQENIIAAKDKYDKQGLGAWVMYSNNVYKKYTS